MQHKFHRSRDLHRLWFFDLDNNNFISALEIRHILKCMGESFVDAEVDEMIKLCDVDGDGQVSYDEFRRMVLDPSPVRRQMQTTSESHAEAQDDSVEKKELITMLLKETKASVERLLQIYDDHQMKCFHSKKTIDFEEFCLLFQTEPLGYYRRLFTLYMENEEVDIRQLLLGMLQALQDGSKDMMRKRVEVCFRLYDDDRNGFLSQSELKEILKANYLVSSIEKVEKKAEVIMRQADLDGNGQIDLDEFHDLARKFPNLLFPRM